MGRNRPRSAARSRRFSVFIRLHEFSATSCIFDREDTSSSDHRFGSDSGGALYWRERRLQNRIIEADWVRPMQESGTGAGRSTRTFILTSGRSGSSLLGAILADAGADFGLSVPDDWDPRSGQMEGTAIRRAAHHYRRAFDISEGRKYVLSPALETKFRLRRGRRHLKRALEESQFLKIGDLDLVVQPSFKLGYEPRVILSYRQFECNLPSLLVGRTHVGPDELAREYVRIYRQGLSLLRTFGGCVVEYNELQDAQAGGWAEALAAITGLDRSALMDSRQRRLRGPADPLIEEPIYGEAYRVYEAMRGLSGRAVEPSRQVVRARDPV